VTRLQDGEARALDAPLSERLLAPAPRLDLGRIRDDVEALAAMQRASAAEEKPQVAWLERRLRDAGAHELHSESFRFQRRWIWRHAAHAGAAAGAAALGGALGASAAAATLASYELELSGKSRWTARFLPAAEGTNVVARIPAAGPAERTIVFVAHHDAQRTGWLWRSPLMTASLAGARERGGPRPLGLGTELVIVLVAFACLVGSRALRAFAAAVLALLTLVGLDVARGRPVPGASDNATGVAALLALVTTFARDPLERTDLIAVFTDCEEVGLGGMAAWMRAHRHELDKARTLVVGLDSLGAGRPGVVTRESPLLGAYPRESLGWADRGAMRAAVAPPARTTMTASTDAIVAHHAGLRALSLVSIDQSGTLGPHYHQPTDTPENVDWESVADCTRLAAGTARVWDGAS
jgi:acetylornithine deacetylase/succinyl-diaminopimelate desuccinylase-like protein